MNSSELRGFLTGLILGDGSIDKGVHKRSFWIKSINRDFIEMIANEINGCSGFKTSIRFYPEHYSNGCNHKDSWELHIAAHPYFCKMYHHFYDDYRQRIISSTALTWLTPRGLANWYMSDGYVCLVGKTTGVIRGRRVDICTDRYTHSDIEKVQKFLLGKYGIVTSIIKRSHRYRLRIQPSGYERFFSLITPYIVPSMRYKLYLAYEQQPIWMSDAMWKLQEDLASAPPLLQCA